MQLSMPVPTKLYSPNTNIFGRHAIWCLCEDVLNIPQKYGQRCHTTVTLYSNCLLITPQLLSRHVWCYGMVFSNIYAVVLHHDFILHFSFVVAMVWSVLAVLTKNLSYRKEGRSEGREGKSFSSSISPGNMDATANRLSSMSAGAKDSTEKMRVFWVTVANK